MCSTEIYLGCKKRRKCKTEYQPCVPMSPKYRLWQYLSRKDDSDQSRQLRHSVGSPPPKLCIYYLLLALSTQVWLLYVWWKGSVCGWGWGLDRRVRSLSSACSPGACRGEESLDQALALWRCHGTLPYVISKGMTLQLWTWPLHFWASNFRPSCALQKAHKVPQHQLSVLLSFKWASSSEQLWEGTFP